MAVFLIVANVISFLLGLLELLVLIRAVLSWVLPAGGGRLVDLIYDITEPIVGPVRALLQRFEFFRRMPVDFSPLIATLLMGLIRNLLDAWVVMFR